MTTPDLIEISDCVFFLTRGLRHHRYYCIAVRGFWYMAKSWGQRASQPSKPSQLSQPYFTRDLHTLLHHCVALTGFWEQEKKKEISDCVFILTRGLHTLLYHCFALRAFKELKNLNLLNPLNLLNRLNPLNLLNPLNPLNYFNFYLCVPIPSMVSAIVLYHDLK